MNKSVTDNLTISEQLLLYKIQTSEEMLPIASLINKLVTNVDIEEYLKDSYESGYYNGFRAAVDELSDYAAGLDPKF